MTEQILEKTLIIWYHKMYEIVRTLSGICCFFNLVNPVLPQNNVLCGKRELILWSFSFLPSDS